jgi:YidC/Oxa1 family membrane protein insertase
MMKVLRPEIEQIGKKYPDKKDAMKKQQDTMALYRETGVSPMAGCVPMLIQMPILFAIFRLFPAEIALRQQSFLWAEDLSTYDSILNIGFEIPLYGAHVSLFTLLMAGTTLVYTHYNSSNMQQPTMEGMPNMKYIMYFFPIMMIFFFNSYSSGLSYYYFISTLMTIGIMFSIKKFMLDEDKIHAKIALTRANPKKAKGKSKFQQRLEEAQKLQQERAKKK